MVDIYITDGGTCLTIGTHIRQFVVLSESLTVVGSTDTTGDVQFLRYDIIPDCVDGMDICRITCQCSHISHTRIHIGSTYSMSHRLFLLDDMEVGLGIMFTSAIAVPMHRSRLAVRNVILFFIVVFVSMFFIVVFSVGCSLHGHDVAIAWS